MVPEFFSLLMLFVQLCHLFWFDIVYEIVYMWKKLVEDVIGMRDVGESSIGKNPNIFTHIFCFLKNLLPNKYNENTPTNKTNIGFNKLWGVLYIPCHCIFFFHFRKLHFGFKAKSMRFWHLLEWFWPCTLLIQQSTDILFVQNLFLNEFFKLNVLSDVLSWVALPSAATKMLYGQALLFFVFVIG